MNLVSLVLAAVRFWVGAKSAVKQISQLGNEIWMFYAEYFVHAEKD